MVEYSINSCQPLIWSVWYKTIIVASIVLHEVVSAYHKKEGFGPTNFQLPRYTKDYSTHSSVAMYRSGQYN